MLLISIAGNFGTRPAKGQVMRKSNDQVNVEVFSMLKELKVLYAERESNQEGIADWISKNKKYVDEKADLLRQKKELEERKKEVDQENENAVAAIQLDIDNLNVKLEDFNRRNTKYTEESNSLDFERMRISGAIKPLEYSVRYLIDHFCGRCVGTIDEYVACWGKYYSYAKINNPMLVNAPYFKDSPIENKEHHYEKDFKPIVKKLMAENLSPRAPIPIVPPQKSMFQKSKDRIKYYLNIYEKLKDPIYERCSHCRKGYRIKPPRAIAGRG